VRHFLKFLLTGPIVLAVLLGVASGQDSPRIGSAIPRDQECIAVHRPERIGRGHAHLFPVMDRDKAGFIDRHGKVIIPLCFDKVGAFSEGVAGFEREGKWGYINRRGKIVIEPQFRWAEEFSEGLGRVLVTGEPGSPTGRWGFIDKSGRIVVPPKFSTPLSSLQNLGGDDPEYSFHQGLAEFDVDYQTGYIDKAGKVVISPQFSYASPFSEGLAAAKKSALGEDGWGYINKSGQWVISPQFLSAGQFRHHLAPVSDGKSCSYADFKGKLLQNLPVERGGSDCSVLGVLPGVFNEGLAPWPSGGKYGFIDRKGTLVVAAQFDLAGTFSDGVAWVRIGKNLGYVNKRGGLVIGPRDFLGVEDFHYGLALVRTQDGKYGYIDKAGKYVWTPRFLYAN
jgi:hypothetical protein